MRKTTLIILILFTVLMSTAGAAVTGTVLTPQQTPMAGVKVSQAGAPANTVTTAADGKFSLAVTSGIINQRKGVVFVPVGGSEHAQVKVYSLGGRLLRQFTMNASARKRFEFPKGIYWIVMRFGQIRQELKYVNLGEPMDFSAYTPKGDKVLSKKSAVISVVFEKAGFTPKTIPLEEGKDHRVGFGAPVGRTVNPAAFPKRPGFNLELAENFDAPIMGDKTDAVWRASDGSWADNACRFVPENVTYAGGNLVLKLTDKPTPAGVPSETEGENYNSGTYTPLPKQYSGAEIRTKGQNYRFGYYEVSMDPPDENVAKGFLATMFTYHTPAEAFWREVDIEVKGDVKDSLLTNVFQLSGTVKWSPQGESGDMVTPGGNYNSREKHIYAFEWLPDSISWFIDGKKVRKFVDETDGTNVAVSWLNHKIIMNFWISPHIGGPFTNVDNLYPIEIKYDYFRFYRWDKDAEYEIKACRSPTHVGCN